MSGIGRYRGSGGAYIQRYRAGQRINIPRHIGRQRTPVVRNTTIFLGGWQGGNHCCCGGGGGGFNRFLTGFTAFMGVFSGFFGGLFGRGNAQQTQQTYVDPYASFGAGYNQGLYGSSLSNFGQYTGAYHTGSASAAQGSDTSLRTQAQKELDAMNNNKKYNYTNGQIPSVTDDGKYKYGDQTYDTISDLEAAIEKDQKQAITPTVVTEPEVSVEDDDDDDVDADGKGGAATASTQKDAKTDYTNSYNNTTGFSYTNGNVAITNKNVPEIVTLSAFFLNNNDESTISLTKKDWKNDFELVFGKDASVSEKDFTNWFEAYAKEAETTAKNSNTQRKELNTVNISESDEAFIKQLYKAMSKNGSTLSAEEFKTFMEDFFKDTTYSKDNSFSRKEFADYVAKKIKEQNKSNDEE